MNNKNKIKKTVPFRTASKGKNTWEQFNRSARLIH